MGNTSYDHVTNQIIQSLEKGVVPWKKPWITLRPQNVSGRKYTGINRLLLGTTDYKYPIFLTMKQANDLGGYIKKGEKANLAVFWKVINKSIDDGGDRKVKPVPVLRYYHVFNIDQTTVPLTKVKNSDQIRIDEGLEDREPIQKAEGLVGSFTDVPAIEFNHEKACYIPAQDKILLPHRHLFQTDEEFYATQFHELIHSTGHSRRLNRKGIQEVQFGSETYSKEELIAEIGACFLNDLCGITATLDNSAAYIQGWMKALEKDSRLIVTAAGQAEKAVGFLLGKAEKGQIDQE
jgi:antirestriction protein ArdC